jgi:hypothetical protein
MHAQQAQDVPLNQMEVVNTSPAIVPWQGTNTQVGAPEEGADTTGVENGTWSSDVTDLRDHKCNRPNIVGKDKDYCCRRCVNIL